MKFGIETNSSVKFGIETNSSVKFGIETNITHKISLYTKSRRTRLYAVAYIVVLIAREFARSFLILSLIRQISREPLVSLFRFLFHFFFPRIIRSFCGAAARAIFLSYRAGALLAQVL